MIVDSAPLKETPVVAADRKLLVTTFRDRARLVTVILDDSDDGRHMGRRIAVEGARAWVIDKTSRIAATEEDARKDHAAAVDVATRGRITN